MEDVKKALLLQMGNYLILVSGVSMTMHDGMKIRGDINIALIVIFVFREIPELLNPKFLNIYRLYHLVAFTLLVKVLQVSVLQLQ